MKIWKTKLFYNNADLGRGKNKPWNVPRRLIATITICSIPPCIYEATYGTGVQVTKKSLLGQLSKYFPPFSLTLPHI